MTFVLAPELHHDPQMSLLATRSRPSQFPLAIALPISLFAAILVVGLTSYQMNPAMLVTTGSSSTHISTKSQAAPQMTHTRGPVSSSNLPAAPLTSSSSLLPLGTATAHFIAAAPAMAAVDAMDWSWVGDLGIFTAKVVIAIGIPAAIIGFFIFKAVRGPRPRAGASMDQEDESFPFFSMGKKQPKGTPKEYLSIDRLNDRLQSYRYSLQKALEGPEVALAGARREQFGRRFGVELAAGLVESQVTAISKVDGQWKERRTNLQKQIDELTGLLRASAVQQAGPMGTEAEMSGMAKMKADRDRKSLSDKLQQALQDQVELEAEYIATLSKILKPEQRPALQRLLKTTPAALLPLDAIGRAQDGSALAAKHVFVLKFFGDIQAAQVKQLRQEVTAILGSAKVERGDEVVLILNTGGGTVTGYGLAAAQLMRLKAKGLKLTICVEEVAASGGYMMACTADRLVASPFAVLGSIGVITEQPNVYERLKREGINWTTTTAGKYKRTLTPFKEPTEEDKAKVKEDVENILVLFARFVKTNRPILNIDEVATGETWFGEDALQRNLCDELKTSDDVLLEFLDQGAELFSLAFKEPPTSPLAQLLSTGAVSEASTWRLALAELLLGTNLRSFTETRTQVPMLQPMDDALQYRLQSPPPLAQVRDPQYSPLQAEDWDLL